MTSPRTPRQWNTGDPEPGDLPNVRDKHGQVWAWDRPYTPGASPWRLEGTEAMTWIGRRQWQELADFHGPLSEVLPETPEPPREDEVRTWRQGDPEPQAEDNRIPEIRAVLDEAEEKVPGVVPMSAWIYDPRAFFDRIRSILDSAPPAPRVFLPNDQVPVGTVLMAKDGSPFRVPDAHTSEGLARVGVPFVEVLVPSPEEWQAAVDRASEERAIPELTEGQNP